MEFNLLSLLPLIFAGLMNGSFVMPARYVKNISNEKIWFYYSIIGLAVIPWIALAIISPHVFFQYFYLPSSILFSLVVGGIIFGLGQLCFAYAIESIGIALSFATNLGVGVTIGSLFVVLYRGVFFSIQGLLVVLAILIIIGSLVLYYYGSKGAHSKEFKPGGWILAFLAGIASGIQNITFFVVAFQGATQFTGADSFWVWPPFLFVAAVIMGIGFLYRSRRSNNASLPNSSVMTSTKNIGLISLMGVFFTGSLAIYSDSMSRFSSSEQVIGWPIFMIFIIFASQAWGWFYGEFRAAATKNKLYSLGSAILLMVAIILLGFKSG